MNRDNETINKIFEKVKRRATRLGIDCVNEDIYDEIELAIEAVNSRRHFIPTETILVEEKHIGIIVRLCIASLSKMGAEGEKSHSENGIIRGYDSGSNYPESILKEIIPLAIAR